MAAGVNRARPPGRGNASPKTTGWPGSVGDSEGYITQFSASSRSQVMLVSDAMSCVISAKTSRGWV